MTRLEIITALMAGQAANTSLGQMGAGSLRYAADLADAIIANDRQQHEEQQPELMGG